MKNDDWQKAKCGTCGYALLWRDGETATCRKHGWGGYTWGNVRNDAPACPDYVRRDGEKE